MPLPPLAPVSAPVTLTDRVASELLNRIEDGQLLANHQLPTEAQMSEQFGVSRTVVREAVNRLKSMGRLVSRQPVAVRLEQRVEH